MTAVDHAELKRLAEGATPGPWYRGHNENGLAQGEMSVWPDAKMIGGMISMTGHQAPWDGWFEQPAKDAAFIAAANPAVVLALLSEIEGLKAECERTRLEAHEPLHDELTRTQAPDSWRPDREEAARIIACHLTDAPDTVCVPITITAGDLRTIYAALRPQTAESGK